MRKLTKLFIVSLILVFSACSFDITQSDVDKIKDAFSEQLDNLYQLYETGAKELLSDFSVQKAEDMLGELLAKIPDNKKQLVYKGLEKGVSLIEDGKEILANELSINVSVEGLYEEIESFLESLSNIDARISVGDVKIEKTDGDYKLDCTINFFYENKN